VAHADLLAVEVNGWRLSMTRNLVGALIFFFGGYLVQKSGGAPAGNKPGDAPLRLGNFCMSLTVKDIAKSREFYEKLGFHVRSGDQAKRWLVLQNETSTIGLFQGFFEKNSLTFNPGWDAARKTLPDFDDVREIQKTLKSRGVEFTTKADESTTGPASFSTTDPDGNPILVDQHVPCPKK
jgi:catechol 2,3-dioxygenase-like lactoylglutathione lyase family enzyme